VSNDRRLPTCDHSYMMNAVIEGRTSGLNSQCKVSETAPVRILLVDHCEPFRTMVSSILKEQPGYQIVGEAADGPKAIQRAMECKPDLVVLDMDLPRLSGIEVARQIRCCSPDSVILFLTLNDDAELAREALHAGARGYVHKFDAVPGLVKATKTVLSGKRFVGRALMGLRICGDC
jgi:DNA-binding NarL/FixJ family response regulator